MTKTHISALLVVLLAGAHLAQAQDESLEDIFAQLDDTSTEASADAGSKASLVGAPAVSADEEMAEEAEEEVAENDVLFEMGVEYYRDGNFIEANKVWDAMLGNDPHDSRAVVYRKRTNKRIASKEAYKKEASQARAMAEVASAWNQERPAEVVKMKVDTDDELTPEEIAAQELEKALKELMIPSLEFRDANINDVVKFLSDTVRKLDLTGRGVNIMLVGVPDAGEMGAVDVGGGITIQINDMSLYDTLTYITEMSEMRFEVGANAVSIMPINYVKKGDIITKTYDIIPEIGADMEAMGSSDTGVDSLFGDSSDDDVMGGPIEIEKFFSTVTFPQGASAVYQPRFGKLIVKNTKGNIKELENILWILEDEAIKRRAQQVNIKAKFVEFAEGAQEELGFDWVVHDNGTWMGMRQKPGTYMQRGNGMSSQTLVAPFNGNNIVYNNPVAGGQITQYNGDPQYGQNGQSLFGMSQRNGGSVFEPVQSGILSSMGGVPSAMNFLAGGDSFPIEMTISALQQEGTADVLSAPQVTTKSGNEAFIRVVEVHRYPQDYDVETGQRTAPVVKPQDWEDVDLGVSLKVTPVVDPDANTIDLDLLPTITAFRGFDDYLVGYNAYAGGGNDTETVVGTGDALYARMPFFEKRIVQTQVTVQDGYTVAMGGLVNEKTETFKDSVPFLGDIPYLGRLFRTEGSRTAKKNLMIFVTAKQVDDRGYTAADRTHIREVSSDD